MSLLELLTGSVVFAAAAGSSLQLWALSGSAAMDQERRQQQLEQVEAVLLRAEQALRRLTPSGGDCATSANLLLQSLAADPLGPGLARHLELAAGGEGVVLRLSVAGEPVSRQRLFRPAALGRCGAPPVPPQGGGGGTP